MAADGGWFKGLPQDLSRWLFDTLKAAEYEVDADAPVADLFKTGVALAKLISHLTNEKVKVKKKCGMIPIQLDNLAVCCTRMEELGIETPKGLAPADFHSGNMKMISGFLTKLAARFPDSVLTAEREEQRAVKKNAAAESKKSAAAEAEAGAAAEEAAAAKLREDAREEHIRARTNSTAVKASVDDMNTAEAAAEEERQAMIVASQEKTSARREANRKKLAEAEEAEEAENAAAAENAEAEAVAAAAAEEAKKVALAEAAAKAAKEAEEAERAAQKAEKEAANTAQAAEAKKRASEAEKAREQAAATKAEQEAQLLSIQKKKHEAAQAKAEEAAKTREDSESVEQWVRGVRNEVLQAEGEEADGWEWSLTAPVKNPKQLQAHQEMALSRLWQDVPDARKVRKGTKLSAWPGVTLDRSKQYAERVSLNNAALESLPDAIVLLGPTLRELNLNRNSFATVPSVVGTLQQLRELDLNGNMISTLPPQIGKLKELRGLYLNANKLTALPAEIKGLKQLRILDIGHNKLTDVEQLKPLEKISHLNMSYNKLQEVPEWVANIPNLKQIDLLGNDLQVIPETFDERNIQVEWHCSPKKRWDAMGGI